MVALPWVRCWFASLICLCWFQRMMRGQWFIVFMKSLCLYWPKPPSSFRGVYAYRCEWRKTEVHVCGTWRYPSLLCGENIGAPCTRRDMRSPYSSHELQAFFNTDRLCTLCERTPAICDIWPVTDIHCVHLCARPWGWLHTYDTDCILELHFKWC